ncbi:phage tail protein I [Thalassomonas haliotis]|uniref:Phage tail protein I n=1 Tax=Thalassomonas haliotis TaxID=485448 RepID=A0ABY7VCW2_9GAMM|nr:phage tail protein I [Thalassomonas haliotis]WDE11166.1 phage tail protein I [Thalassomonas haliotis]
MADLNLSGGSTLNASGLPANTSELGYQLEQVMNSGFSADNLPVGITKLWQPESCPEHLLPWLAWANGVKNWDDSWPEQTRRGVIANSFEVHSYQGTRYAIEKALQPLKLETEIHEWFEVEPNTTPGTFTVDVYVSEQGITDELIDTVHESITSNKRGSSHYTLTMNLSAPGDYYQAGALQLVGEVDGKPFEPVLDGVDSSHFRCGSLQVHCRIEGEPYVAS